ncbi:hypothetical protein ACHAXR_005668 [Thalassiosira sp. AJA248-18]
MILSLVVSVVGFQAGLDSHFHPFRRRLDIFGRRVYEILRDAGIVYQSQYQHDDIGSRMRWSKISQLAEICLSFLILNLVGVIAVQLSMLGEENDVSLSWMESFYWAVQTTTTIGYGDVTIPENLWWFFLLYLAISTYFVGSAFGRLGELNNKIEAMQRLYLWQQQEASYTMLNDFSGRPDRQDDKSNGKEVVQQHFSDQFEFTIASLVVMGKITSEDVKPIIEKFQRLTGKKPNKITSSDVSGPLKEPDDIIEEVRGEDKENIVTDENEIRSSKSLSTGALVVGKKIAKAFREEILSSNVNNDKDTAVIEKETAIDYSNFRIPDNTCAIGIDDSKIQRKLLAKFFSFAGIPPERCTIVGDGHDEIMGFLDENLDVVVDESSEHMTISGSLCVENIRKRLPAETERRMLALIRSANDSSSDIAIYNQRAHGFLPKAPIKPVNVLPHLAPLWQKRFPTSEFGESILTHSSNDEAVSSTEDIACSPYDIAQKMIDIESLFERKYHISDSLLIKDEIHKLKGDLLTLNSNNISVTTVIGQINLIQVTQAPDTLIDRWQTLRDNIEVIIKSLQKHIEKHFRIPSNTYVIAIDDSKIQRKLLSKFVEFMGVPPENSIICGETATEIKGFEEMVVKLMHKHKDDYVFMIVDENLDVVDEASKHESISGS